jgi:hypothetical protein
MRPADAGATPPPHTLVSHCRRGPMAWVHTCAPSDRLAKAGGEDPPTFLDEAEVAAFYESRQVRRPRPTHGVAGICELRQVPRRGETEPRAVELEPTLLCHQTKLEEHAARGPDGQMQPFYRRIDYVVGHVVRGGKLVKVLDEPVLLDQVDKFDLEDGPIFELAVVVEGERVVVREPEPGACAVASSTLAEEAAKAGDDKIALLWAQTDRRLLDRLCRAAGIRPPATPRGPSPGRGSF